MENLSVRSRIETEFIIFNAMDPETYLTERPTKPKNQIMESKP